MPNIDFLDPKQTTVDAIRDRLLGRVNPAYDVSEGSFFWDMLSPSSFEMAELAAGIQYFAQVSFLLTSSGEYLDRFGVIFDTPRLLPTKAVGSVSLYGANGHLVPAGTQVSTAGTLTSPSVSFVTDSDARISGGIATVTVTAVGAGAAGNVQSGTVVLLASSDTQVSSVSNAAAMSGGADLEGDDAYKSRLILAVRRDLGRANVSQLQLDTLSVNGVGFALVDPLWNGEGTVRVVILDSAGNIPSGGLVAEVQEILDPSSNPAQGYGLADISQLVTVVAPSDFPLYVRVPGLVQSPDSTLTSARASALSAVMAYLSSVNPGGVIRVRQIEDSIEDANGVLDVGDITVSTDNATFGRSNITLTAIQKVSLAALTWT